MAWIGVIDETFPSDIQFHFRQVFRPLRKPCSSSRLFQLEGLCNSDLGEHEKAIECFTEALRFGDAHLERIEDNSYAQARPAFALAEMGYRL